MMGTSAHAKLKFILDETGVLTRGPYTSLGWLVKHDVFGAHQNCNFSTGWPLHKDDAHGAIGSLVQLITERWPKAWLQVWTPCTQMCEFTWQTDDLKIEHTQLLNCRVRAEGVVCSTISTLTMGFVDGKNTVFGAQHVGSRYLSQAAKPLNKIGQENTHLFGTAAKFL